MRRILAVLLALLPGLALAQTSGPYVYSAPSSGGAASSISVGATLTGGTNKYCLFDDSNKIGEDSGCQYDKALDKLTVGTVVVSGGTLDMGAADDQLITSLALNALTIKNNGGGTLNFNLGSATILQLTTAGGLLVSGKTLRFGGSSSGVVTMQAQAAAGTYNLNLPTTAGNSGQVLASAGGGSSPMTWLTPLPLSGTSVDKSVCVFETSGGTAHCDDSGILFDPTNNRLSIGSMTLGAFFGQMVLATSATDTDTAIANTDPQIAARQESQTDNTWSQLGTLMKNASGTTKTASLIGTQNTDHTAGSEDADFVVGLVQAGTVGEKFRVTNAGNLTVPGTLTAGSGPTTITNSTGKVLEGAVAFTDVTTGNATSSQHGYLPKLSGSASDVLKGDGTFGAGGGSAKMQFTSSGPNLPTGTTAKVAKITGYGVAASSTGLTDGCDSVHFTRMVMAGTFKNLYCSTNGISSGSIAIALSTASSCTAAASSLTVTLNSGAGHVSDTTHTVSASVNDFFVLVMTPSSPVYSTNGWTCSMEFDPS